MEIISWALGDEASVQLLSKVVALTLFYATLAWLPLRGTTIMVRRWKEASERKRRDRMLRSCHAMR